MTRKQCNTHKHSEAGIESWTNTSESAQGNRVQSRSKAEAYIDMNIKPRTKVKNDFKKELFKLMKKSLFGKTMRNLRKKKDQTCDV